MRILILLLAGAVAAVELVAPSFVEARIEARVRENLGGSAAVEADIDSFPMVTRALLTSEVRELSLDLREVTGQQLSFSRIGLVLHGVRLNRSAMLQGKAEVEDISAGEAVAEIDLAQLATALGVSIDAAALTEVRVRQGVLEVSVAGAPIQVAVPVEALPCEPDGGVEGDRLVLRCTFTEIPSVLIEAAAQVSA